MRWSVIILAVVAILVSAASIYYAYIAGLPVGHEIGDLSGLSAPVAAGAVATCLLRSSFERMPT